MERKIIGLENVDYTSKKTGQPVKGIKIHATGINANVKGEAAEQFFVSVRAEGLYPKVTCFKVGDVIDIDFNNYGGINDIEYLNS